MSVQDKGFARSRANPISSGTATHCMPFQSGFKKNGHGRVLCLFFDLLAQHLPKNMQEGHSVPRLDTCGPWKVMLENDTNDMVIKRIQIWPDPFFKTNL